MPFSGVYRCAERSMTKKNKGGGGEGRSGGGGGAKEGMGSDVMRSSSLSLPLLLLALDYVVTS